MFLKFKMIGFQFFIWAARLPAVAVGLYALLRFARAAPIPAATELRSGIGIIQAATEGTGIRSRRRQPNGLTCGYYLAPFQVCGGRFRRSLRSRRNGGWLPPSATCRHPARVPEGRTPSNLRQDLLRPQSGVGNRTEDWRGEGTLHFENQLLHAIFYPFPAIFRCKIAKNGKFAAENFTKNNRKNTK